MTKESSPIVALPVYFQVQGMEPIDVLIEEKNFVGIRVDINPYLNDPENCWSLWEADLWKMQKAFADYAALDCSAECPRRNERKSARACSSSLTSTTHFGIDESTPG